MLSLLSPQQFTFPIPESSNDLVIVTDSMASILSRRRPDISDDDNDQYWDVSAVSPL